MYNIRFIIAIFVFNLFFLFSVSSTAEFIDTDKHKGLILKEAQAKWREYLRKFRQFEAHTKIVISRATQTSPNTLIKAEEHSSHSVFSYPNSSCEWLSSDNLMTIMGNNGNYQYHLSQTNDDLWKIDEISRIEMLPSFKDWDFQITLSRDFSYKSFSSATSFISSALVLNHICLPALVVQPEFEVKAVEELDLDDEKLVRISFIFSPSPTSELGQRMNIRHGELYLMPDNYWLIKRATCFFESSPPYTIQVETEYDFTQPFPILTKKISSTSYDKTYDELPSMIAYEYNISFPEQVDSSIFYLSHYGFPEPDFGDRQANRLRYIIIGAGLLLMGIGAWSMVQKRRENV